MLEPTSPLRNSKDVDFCINKIKKDNIESLVSVSRVVDQHPYFLYSINKRNILRPYLKKQKKTLYKETRCESTLLLRRFYLHFENYNFIK